MNFEIPVIMMMTRLIKVVSGCGLVKAQTGTFLESTASPLISLWRYTVSVDYRLPEEKYIKTLISLELENALRLHATVVYTVCKMDYGLVLLY